jgi:hypothetical protein
VLIKDIKDELGAVFEARGKTAKDEADEVDKTKLLELSAEEVIVIGLPAVPELDHEVINLPDKLIFTTRRAGEPISGVNVKSNDLPD